MAKIHVLYNPLAGNHTWLEKAKTIEGKYPEENEFVYDDITKITDFSVYGKTIPSEDIVILAGGDGTLNKFVNLVDENKISRDLYFYPVGSGNDFYSDVKKDDNGIVKLNDYLVDLPTTTINGKSYKFINGVGYGIDGYCCEVGDKIRETSDKPINYAGIAIKGIFFHYKATNAKVTVDGKEYTFNKVWLAPTMKGRFYGGGMMIAPNQNRFSADKTLSVVIFHNSSILKTLIILPSIFKGTHIAYDKFFTVLTGSKIKVEYDRPVAAQVDGETVLNVTKVESSI